MQLQTHTYLLHAIADTHTYRHTHIPLTDAYMRVRSANTYMRWYFVVQIRIYVAVSYMLVFPIDAHVNRAHTHAVREWCANFNPETRHAWERHTNFDSVRQSCSGR